MVSSARSAAEELSFAEQCDAKGDHDEAVNALARATQLGDVEATTRLGKRLLVGKDAPLLPADGARFLVSAVNSGGAEAAARLAVLAAAGAYVDPSLDGALRLLVLAAQRGWQPARAQLLALTPDRELAAAVTAARASEGRWQRLADSISIAYWTSAAEKRPLCRSPLICAFDSLLPDPVCRWLIERSAGRLERALVYDAVAGQDYASETRTNSWAQFDLAGSELIHLLVQRRMEAACGISIYNMEATAVLHYAVGEQISDHFDFVDPKIPNYDEEIRRNGQRVLTFLVYLNDDYEGGETEFPELGIVHKGRSGEGLFFVNALDTNEPDLRTLHAGRPPRSGEKWVVSQFVRSRRVLAVAS
jgi:prolyl 4-hydroxylase